MSGNDDELDPLHSSHFRPADPLTQEEVGGVLERAFRREGGDEPQEAEARRFLELADEAEGRAEAAEALTREAERAATQAAERYALSGGTDDLAAIKRWQEAASEYRREGASQRLEAERLRKYLP